MIGVGSRDRSGGRSICCLVGDLWEGVSFLGTLGGSEFFSFCIAVNYVVFGAARGFGDTIYLHTA